MFSVQHKGQTIFYTPLTYEYAGENLNQVFIKFYFVHELNQDKFRALKVHLKDELRAFRKILPTDVKIEFRSHNEKEIQLSPEGYTIPLNLKILEGTHSVGQMIYHREQPFYMYMLSEIARNDLLVIMIVSLFAIFSSLVIFQKFIRPLQQLIEMSAHIQKQQHLDVDSNNDFESISTTLLELTNSLIDKQKQLDFQKVALDSSAIVAETDPRGKIIYVNDKFVEISRYSREELIGQSHRIINSAHHSKEFFKKMWETIKEGRIWRGEVKNKTKDGNEYWVDTTIVPFKNSEGKLIKFVAIRFDITQLKKTEDLLHQQTAIASNALKAKDNFIANMSHEIRNPLNSILGLADILEETNLNISQKSYLKSLKFSSDSLLHLVNEILDLSKIQSGKLELESISFDFLNLCENVLEMVALKNQNDSVNFYIDFAPDVPMSLIGDPHRLKQVLVNLLGNAIKFTKQGSITLTVRHINTNLIDHNTNLAISVSDTGVGIEQKNLEKIFDSYSQEHSGISREFGGTGLGLNIVQKIIQEMDGDIKVNSIKDKGTIFTCHLSFEIPMATQNGFNHSMSQILMDKNIFILDNDTKRSKILKTMLESSHAKHVETTINTSSLESKPQELNNYDYIFLSTNLGEKNRALKIFDYIKSNKHLQERTIYLLSDSGNKNEIFLKEKLNSNQLSSPLIPTKVEKSLSSIYDKGHLKTVLVIDDEVEILEQYKETLADQNYKVLTAENVTQALELFTKNKVDTIVSDLKLPGRSGLDFFKEVRQKDPNVPLIMISGFLTDKVRNAAQKFNTVDCVSKPFNNEKILHLISETMSNGQTIRRDSTPLLEETKVLNILLVDDSEDNRNLIKLYFKDSKHELTFATNGQEAFDLYIQNDFDIVFMDIQMPVLSGIEAMKKIRKWEKKNHTERTLFYALTANVLEAQRQEALQSGYDGFLSKPIKKKDIFEIINIEDWVNSA